MAEIKLFGYTNKLSVKPGENIVINANDLIQYVVLELFNYEDETT